MPNQIKIIPLLLLGLFLSVFSSIAYAKSTQSERLYVALKKAKPFDVIEQRFRASFKEEFINELQKDKQLSNSQKSCLKKNILTIDSYQEKFDKLLKKRVDEHILMYPNRIEFDIFILQNGLAKTHAKLSGIERNKSEIVGFTLGTHNKESEQRKERIKIYEKKRAKKLAEIGLTLTDEKKYLEFMEYPANEALARLLGSPLPIHRMSNLVNAYSQSTFYDIIDDISNTCNFLTQKEPYLVEKYVNNVLRLKSQTDIKSLGTKIIADVPFADKTRQKSIMACYIDDFSQTHYTLHIKNIAKQHVNRITLNNLKKEMNLLKLDDLTAIEQKIKLYIDEIYNGNKEFPVPGAGKYDNLTKLLSISSYDTVDNYYVIERIRDCDFKVTDFQYIKNDN